MIIGIAGPVFLSSIVSYLDTKGEALPEGMPGTAVGNLVTGLHALGHEVHIYTLDPKTTTPKIFEGERFKIYVGQYRPNRRLRVLDLFAKEARQIKQFIQQDKPEFVNAHWSYEYALGAINSKCPHLISFRDAAWEILKFHKDYYRVARFMLDYWVKKRGKFFNVNSIYLQEKLNYMGKDLPIIPNPINEEYIQAQSRTHPKGKINVVSIQNFFSKRKNTSTSLLAFQKLRQEYGDRVEYYLYGQNYEPDGKAQIWAEEHQCTEGVHFMGRVQYTDLMAKMSDFHILLHPALEESFGNTLLEGMASGIPVIAGEDAGAVPWVLNYGKNGILIDVLSVEATVNAMKKLIEDATLYEYFSKEGMDYVKQNFSSNRVAEQYVELYQKILAKKGK